MNDVSTRVDPSKLKLRAVPSVKALLVNDEARQQLASVAAKHMNPERMMRVVANAIRTTPTLQDCDPMSMLGALMTCASLGLEPNTPLGFAYLIPFKNRKKGITEAQLVIGYKGFADLARRSGQVTSLHADVVYSDDELWSYEYGSEMHLRHKPGPRKGRKTHAYCHVTLKDGQAFVVLPWDQVIATRDSSQGWKSAARFGTTASNPWHTHEDRMGAKTAVRALANAGEMPMSIEFMQAADVDEHHVDYRSFAMDPTAGTIIDGDVSDMDDEADGADGAQMLEHDPTPQRTVEPEPARTRAPARATQPREDTGPYVDSAKPKAEAKPKPKAVKQQEEESGLFNEKAAEPEPEAKKPAEPELTPLMSMVLADLRDSGLDTVNDLHGDALDRLQVENPGQWKRLQALMQPIIDEQG